MVRILLLFLMTASPSLAQERYVKYNNQTFDMQTYNSNCPCGMCIYLRGKKAEYFAAIPQPQLRQQLPAAPEADVTPEPAIERMLELLNPKYYERLGELGAGDGRVAIAAAKKYGCSVIAIEIDPKRAAVARKNVKTNNVDDLVTVELGDIKDFDFNRIDIATMYLYEQLLDDIKPQLETLDRFVSYSHPVNELHAYIEDNIYAYGVNPQQNYSELIPTTEKEHTVVLYTDPENCPPCAVLEKLISEYGELPFNLEIRKGGTIPRFEWPKFHGTGNWIFNPVNYGISNNEILDYFIRTWKHTKTIKPKPIVRYYARRRG
jgi:hypothetical protein